MFDINKPFRFSCDSSNISKPKLVYKSLIEKEYPYLIVITGIVGGECAFWCNEEGYSYTEKKLVNISDYSEEIEFMRALLTDSYIPEIVGKNKKILKIISILEDKHNEQ